MSRHSEKPRSAFRPLAGEPRALICTTRGFAYPEGNSLDAVVIYDGEPPGEFRWNHGRSDLLAVSRKACPLDAIVSQLNLTHTAGFRPEASERFIPGEPSYDEYFVPIRHLGKLHVFVRTTPWVERGYTSRYFTYVEITEKGYPIQTEERPSQVYFDRIAPDLDHPLIDKEFVASLIAAPNRFEYSMGDEAEFRVILRATLTYLALQLDLPNFSGHYKVSFKPNENLSVDLLSISPHPSSFAGNIYELARDRIAAAGDLPALVELALSRIFKERVRSASRIAVRLPGGNPLYRSNWVPDSSMLPIYLEIDAGPLSGHERMALEFEFGRYLEASS